MKRLVLALALSALATPVAAKHLLRQLPDAVRAAVWADCQEQWPDSDFQQGWCADDEAALWIKEKKTDGKGKKSDLGMHIPDIMIKPDGEKK
jgi:hypothetical protein